MEHLRPEDHDGSVRASLPYGGDLDAARKARDIHAVRVLTQLRDRDVVYVSASSSSVVVSSSSSSRHGSDHPLHMPRGTRRAVPAASSSTITTSSSSTTSHSFNNALTRRLLDMGFSIQQAELAAMQNPADVAEAISWLSSLAAAEGERPPLPPPGSMPSRRGSPPIHSSSGTPFKSSAQTPKRAASQVATTSPPPPPVPMAPHGAGDISASPRASATLEADASTTSSATLAMQFMQQQQQQQQSGHGVAWTTTTCCESSTVCFAPCSSSQPASAQWPSELGKLLQMGYSEEVATSALRKKRGNLEAALILLLDHQGNGAEEAKGGSPRLRGQQQQRTTEGSSSSSRGGAGGPSKKSPTAAAEEEEMEDPILLCRLPVSQMFQLECRCGHWFGFETLYCGIKAALADDLIPACPLANHPEEAQRCNYLLQQKEVEQVLNRYKSPSQLPSEERRMWRFKRGRLIDGTYGWVSEKVSDAFLRKGKIDAGCIECPNGRCGYWVEPMRPLERQRIDCPKCLGSFCSLCKRHYHYRCNCDEVMTITRQWLEWNQHGREPYLRRMAEEDSSYQSALDVFNSRLEAHAQEVRVAEHNWDLLVADENYKASRCRRCPNCDRVIERIDGCDTMVCGQNAHGGNIQNGCGHGFNWNEARPYHADIGQRKSIRPFEEARPAEVVRVRHMITEGQPIKCDICSAPIQGPMAQCINCPTFNCCIRCQNKHTRGHVLRLYMDSSHPF